MFPPKFCLRSGLAMVGIGPGSHHPCTTLIGLCTTLIGPCTNPDCPCRQCDSGVDPPCLACRKCGFGFAGMPFSLPGYANQETVLPNRPHRFTQSTSQVYNRPHRCTYRPDKTAHQPDKTAHQLDRITRQQIQVVRDTTTAYL